jgi:uncharacterized membrane protein YjgN (DUF898 family)
MTDQEINPETPSPLLAASSKPPTLFEGSRMPLFWLLLRNLLLTIITVGIYRFWAKTRVRQFFWRHTKLLGDRLEYLGTGGELLVGFLVALVVLVPLGAIYSLLQFFSIGQTFWVSLTLDAVYYTLILFLIQIAIHRMRRYRLTRTAWRGVRFGLDGSSFKYALISFGYGILSLLTLWLGHPWLRVATMKYFFNHARFGTASLSLDCSGGWLFKRWIVFAIPFAIGIGAFFGLNWETFAEMGTMEEKSAKGQDMADELLALFQQIEYWPLAIFVASTLIRIWYSVVEFRYMVSGLRIVAVSIQSNIPVAFVYRVYALFWLAVLGLVGLITLSTLYFPLHLDAPPIAHMLTVLTVLALFPLLGILKTIFVDVTLLKRVCATLSIENVADLEKVVQSSADLPSHGEGLADALDVGGF